MDGKKCLNDCVKCVDANNRRSSSPSNYFILFGVFSLSLPLPFWYASGGTLGAFSSTFFAFSLFLSLSFAGVRLPNRLAVEQMTQSSPTLECRLSSRSPREKSERERTDFETEYKVCAHNRKFLARNSFALLLTLASAAAEHFLFAIFAETCLSAKSVVVFLFTHCFKIEFLLFITAFYFKFYL